MGDEKITKPTIETVLERLGSLEGRLDARFVTLEERLNNKLGALEERLGIRLDRIESVVNTTRGEMLELRAQLREHFPALS